MRRVLIDRDLREEVGAVVCFYVENFISDFHKGMIKRSQYDDALLFCAEILRIPLLKKYEEEIENIVKKILETIESELYQGIVDNLYYIGTYKGIGSIAFSLQILNQKGMKLIQFQKYFDDLLTRYYDLHINLFYKNPTVSVLYDTIYGLTGLLNYYLEYCCEKKEVIEGLLKYLIFLTEKNEAGVVNYFIMELPEYSNVKTENIPYLDFGMAHGILGPLIVIGKARNQGFKVQGMTQAIHVLNDLYKEYTLVSEEGILKFPVQLRMQEYKEKKVINCSFNCGWCYGNSSVVLGLMRTANFCGNKNDYEYYKENLVKILLQSTEKYGFSEPIVCHGYAGILMIQMSAYMQTNDSRFLNTLNQNVCATLKCHAEHWKKNNYGKEYSLLEGASGVVLALLKVMEQKIESSKLLLLE